MIDNILVTGATGTVGSEVVKVLMGKNCAITVGVRNRANLDKFPWSKQVNIVDLDYSKPETIKPALDKANKIFIVTPSGLQIEEDVVHSILNACNHETVNHIIRLSGMGVEHHDIFGYHKSADDILLNSDINATILRPNFFMQNLYKYQTSIKDQHKIIEPAKNGKISFIDVGDIAEIVANVFIQSGHENMTYELTGDESLDYQDVAAQLTNELGTIINYEPLSCEEYVTAIKAGGMPEGVANKFEDLYRRVQAGEYSSVSPNSARILGRQPTTLREFIKKNKDKFMQ